MALQLGRAPLAAAALALGACAAPRLPADPADVLPPPASDAEGASREVLDRWAATEKQCLTQDRAARQTAADGARTRQIAMASLAAVAGAAAGVTAVYAARTESPNANVIVPVAAGGGAAAVPLFILLVDGGGDGAALAERGRRMSDHRQRVRAAYDELVEAREAARIAAADRVGLDEKLERPLGDATARLGEVGASVDDLVKKTSEAPADKAPAPAKSSPTPPALVASEQELVALRARATGKEASRALSSAVEALRAQLDARKELAERRERRAEQALDDAVSALAGVCVQDSP